MFSFSAVCFHLRPKLWGYLQRWAFWHKVCVFNIDCKKDGRRVSASFHYRKVKLKHQYGRCHLAKMTSFGARVCAVESWGGAAESNSRPNKLLAKMKLITKMNNWTYIRVITTTLNDQNHILENCIGSVIYFYILTQVPFVYMERAGFMTCTAASHQGAIKEPAASLFDMWGTPI